jgi:hypothetical protein
MLAIYQIIYKNKKGNEDFSRLFSMDDSELVDGWDWAFARALAMPDKTAVAPVAMPPQEKEPKPLFPNNAPVFEEMLRRFLKKKGWYSDIIRNKAITPWDLIELQIKARETGLNPTKEKLFI